MTLRESISQIQTFLKELNADSRASKKGIYSKLITIGSLVMQRESDNFKLLYLQEIYQTLKCVNIEEAPSIDNCCGIKSIKKVYRTSIKIPEMYVDTNGAIIKRVLSIDESSEIQLVTPDFIRRTLEDTNSKYDNSKYAFYKDNYIYFMNNIKKVNIEACFIQDISHDNLCNCNGDKTAPCFSFLDREWKVPIKLQDNIISAVIDSYMNTYERKQEDININKKPGM